MTDLIVETDLGHDPDDFFTLCKSLLCGNLPYTGVECLKEGGTVMATVPKNDARVDFRLSTQAKALIEEAAALTGQSLSDFAVSTLLEKANQVLDAKRLRSLSERDARIFLNVLDREQPNEALREAAAWYKENHGGSLDD
jgi:uncharacterized protein (DUF1778 family)